MEKPTHHFVVLLHGIDWSFTECSEYMLSEGIKICNYNGSHAEIIYLDLCENFSYDEGDPFRYDTYIYVELQSDPEHIPHEQGPESTISRLCNLLSVTLNTPISWYRIISVTKDLKYAGFTDDISITHTVEDLEAHYSSLTIELMENLKKLWISDRELRKDYKINSRMINSLDYYFYAWRGWNLEQTCINLSIVLETLFSPPSNNELSHRIAYNACRFMGTNKSHRQHIYNMLKKYYNLRSQIVHGKPPKYEILRKSTKEVLPFCANVLNRILIDKKLISTFNDNEKREEYFNDWLFD